MGCSLFLHFPPGNRPSAQEIDQGIVLIICRNVKTLRAEVSGIVGCLPVVQMTIFLHMLRIIVVITPGTQCGIFPFRVAGDVRNRVSVSVMHGLHIFAKPSLIPDGNEVIGIIVEIVNSPNGVSSQKRRLRFCSLFATGRKENNDAHAK